MFVNWAFELMPLRDREPAPCSGQLRAAVASTELRADAWLHFFDSLMVNSEGVRGTVEVVRDDLTPETPELAGSLQQIAYRSDDDTLALTLGSPHGSGPVRYFITPQRIHVTRGDEAVELLVDEPGGTRTRIRFFHLHAAFLDDTGVGALQTPCERHAKGPPREI
jgi:hypothetical protein